MTAREILHTAHVIALTSSWWAFAMWPKLGAGEPDVGVLIMPCATLTILAIYRIVFWASENWDE